jgi:predicted O-linked N-acetylglucosamine transferase (SPINDLY family)
MLGRLIEGLRGARARRANARGTSYWREGRLAEAEKALRDALRLDSRHVTALSNLGMVLIEAHREDEGLALLRRAVEIDPRHAGAQNNLGAALVYGNNPVAAIEHFSRALEANPELPEAHANLFGPLMEVCGWRQLERLTARLVERAAAAPLSDWPERVRPFEMLGLPIPRELQRAAGHYYGAKFARQGGRRLAPAAGARPARLRIGYASADFRNHATTHLCGGLFGRHDRNRFEVIAYSFGEDDGSEYRKRVARDCDRFVDVSRESYEQTARRIASDGIHVLVDMKGYCFGHRAPLFAWRPAPVQVSWLGYPASMYAPFMDYLVADAVVVPPGDEGWYDEQIIRLPCSYQVNDQDQPVDPRPPRREEEGLPPSGFVLCSFNHNWKIDAGIFASWMRILREVPGSVLWLLRSNVPAKYALWKAADSHDVDRARIVFAQLKPKPQHLARMALADLVVDTHYYNGHTSTSDALWAGVPVLTWPGETFASRVAASLLRTAGLPELILATREDYEREAIRLAREPATLARFRSKLNRDRLRRSLYDTHGYTRALEEAYEQMWASAPARSRAPRRSSSAP